MLLVELMEFSCVMMLWLCRKVFVVVRVTWWLLVIIRSTEYQENRFAVLRSRLMIPVWLSDSDLMLT